MFARRRPLTRFDAAREFIRGWFDRARPSPRVRFLARTRAPTRAPARYALTRSVFLRGLGLVYLLAFTSLRVQVRGLLGARGLRPAKAYLDLLRDELGDTRWRTLPTLFWLDASDRTLVRAATAGQLFALALLLGILPWPMAALCWVTYLSFVAVGREFLQFQWDQLLVETGLHALLVAPGPMRLAAARRDPSWPIVMLLRLHAFRFHFESGLAKRQSGDRTWRDLTALAHYYETAPLPTRLGWHAHHLPHRIQRFSTAATLVIECLVPFLGLGPRGPRRVAFGALMFLQVLIAATGNYGFFNVLAAVVSVWFLDDAVLERLLPGARPRPPSRPPRMWRRLLDAALATPLLLLGSGELASRFGRGHPSLTWLMRRSYPFLLPGSYGLFAVMTTERPEITIEGTDDLVTWRPYRFRWKADDPMRAPRLVAPHQPRLDWQMWFAALGPPPTWFLRLLQRLLEGSPDVLALFESVPFDHPPKAVRARLSRYRMADRKTHRETGAWWTREAPRLYVPPLTLTDDGDVRLATVPPSEERLPRA